MFKNLYKKNISGFVLVTALLFTSVLTILGLSLLESSILENRMFLAYYEKMKSFYLAEKQLIELESRGCFGSENVEIIDAGICGMVFCQISAQAKFKRSKTVLKSIIAEDYGSKKCSSKVLVKPGRQSFMIN